MKKKVAKRKRQTKKDKISYEVKLVKRKSKVRKRIFRQTKFIFRSKDNFSDIKEDYN